MYQFLSVLRTRKPQVANTPNATHMQENPLPIPRYFILAHTHLFTLIHNANVLGTKSKPDVVPVVRCPWKTALSLKTNKQRDLSVDLALGGTANGAQVETYFKVVQRTDEMSTQQYSPMRKGHGKNSLHGQLSANCMTECCYKYNYYMTVPERPSSG